MEKLCSLMAIYYLPRNKKKIKQTNKQTIATTISTRWWSKVLNQNGEIWKLATKSSVMASLNTILAQVFRSSLKRSSQCDHMVCRYTLFLEWADKIPRFQDRHICRNLKTKHYSIGYWKSGFICFAPNGGTSASASFDKRVQCTYRKF